MTWCLHQVEREPPPRRRGDGRDGGGGAGDDDDGELALYVSAHLAPRGPLPYTVRTQSP